VNMETTMLVKKNIALPTGGTLEVDMTDKFLDVVKNHFELASVSEIHDEHLRLYIWGAFKNAVDKAEKETTT